MGERREKASNYETSIQAIPEKKRTVHFSTLLLHSPLLSGCAVRIIREKMEERERGEQEKKKTKQYVECVHARGREQTNKQKDEYLPLRRRKKKREGRKE